MKYLWYFTNRNFDDYINSFLLLSLLLGLVLFLDFRKQLLRFFFIHLLLYTIVTGELAVFVHNAKADDTVAIFDKFFYQPFGGVVGILIVIGAAEEGAGALGVIVVLVPLADVEVRIGCVGIAEGVEGDAAFIFAGMDCQYSGLSNERKWTVMPEATEVI